MLTNYKNLRQFIDTKNLSFGQVSWAQNNLCYHFQIDYCQGKTNKATDILFQYSQQSAKEKKTLSAKNIKILHRLQSLLAKISSLLVDLSQLSLLYQIFICKMIIFPKFPQIWETLQSDIIWNSPYIVNIRDMKLWLYKLQNNNKEAKTSRDFTGLLEDWKNIEGVFQCQRLPYILEIICFEVINGHHNDPLARYFSIDKSCKLIGREYY